MSDLLALQAARCRYCECRLAGDNTQEHCSPCAARIGRNRWRSVPAATVQHVTAQELETVGILTLLQRHATSPAQMIAALFASGTLPLRLRRHETHLVALLGLQGRSHSDAARDLSVTRWTVAAWRLRLGLGDGSGVLAAPAKPVSKRQTKEVCG
ncbi:unannotated protein [freshwater metagenome]|uniref:Unannotated protein n=1 Tax=freshwater metagenome TaxID=449393 RepID=A0A6J7EZB5_9ZZZZ|nr:hypothetical protein [Actinomycetota bacterium]